MKIFFVTQNEVCGYDTYDSLVVIAENEDEARLIGPYYPEKLSDKKNISNWGRTDSWISIEEIDKLKVEYLGEAKPGSEKGIVLCSFNAG